MTRKELDDVKAASKRERAHAKGKDGGSCFCGACIERRFIIARAMPAILELLESERFDAGDFGGLS